MPGLLYCRERERDRGKERGEARGGRGVSLLESLRAG